MGVIQYIPKKKFVIDKRSEDGGYYEALCDECGNTFYPLRSSAKYCSRSCQVMYYRKNLSLKKSKSVKKELFKSEFIFTGASNLAIGMKTYINYGDLGLLKTNIKALEIGSIYNYKNFIVKRISTYKYAVKTI